MNDCYLNFLVSFRALFSLDVGANLVNSKQTIGIILPDLSLLGYAVPVESFGIGLFVILFAYLIIEYNVQLLSHEKFKIAMNMLHTAHTPLILLRNQLEELKTGNLPEPLSQQVEEALGYAECIIYCNRNIATLNKVNKRIPPKTSTVNLELSTYVTSIVNQCRAHANSRQIRLIIPMTVSFFLKRNKDKKKGIRDAWTYGASIVVIYVTLGLAITLIFGASALNALSTNAVFNILFFLMLIIFAASFFGAFELTLPSKWSNAVDSKAEATSGLLSIFLMAFTLSLVSFSCTGPIIGFLLVQVSTTGSVIAPAIGMLGFAIALALPFTLFALFPSWLKSMPKSGGWMNVIKVTLGFLELAFALKFLSVADLAYGWRILDRETFLALWIVIFGLMGLYLLGKIKFPHDGDESRVGVARFFLALVSLAFAVYMIPGLWGAPLKAVSAFAPPVMTQDFNLYSNEVHPRFKNYDIGMEYARQQGMPVMVDFTGYGCVNCRKMEAAVWTDSKVGGIINDQYVLISLYVDDKTPLNEPLKVTENGTERTLRTVGDKWSYLQRVKFGANAQPFYVLLDNDGNPLNKSYAYNEDITSYIEFLQKGLEHYVK